VAGDRPTFRLLLKAEPPKYGDAPAAVRLRKLLKIALRGLGFRCLEVREVAVEEQGADKPGGPRAYPECPDAAAAG
jgi:hypothetical protein